MTLTETKLHKAILGRDRSFLAEDIEAASDRIREQLADARVLVIGAAGSIGSSFVRELCQFQPSGLHLLDISENNLVEVVRDLRSGAIRCLRISRPMRLTMVVQKWVCYYVKISMNMF